MSYELTVVTIPSLHDLGCVGLLLETISPFLDSSSPILNHALRIVEVLGAYRSVQFYPAIPVTICFLSHNLLIRFFFCSILLSDFLPQSFGCL